MFCIAAFIVLLFLAVISARYRKMLGKAWRCVARRVTFRACDTTFKQDVKDHLLAPLAIRNPALVRPASVILEVVAVLIVISTVVSLYIVVRAGLNLWVYNTCDKQDAQSCSLGSQSCSIEQAVPGFWESVASGDVIGAFSNEFSSLAETISLIPSRMKTWDASEYLPENVSWANEYDASKPTALEVLDPGCEYCQDLFQNILESGFDQSYNLAYIAFPIPDGDGYKFANSYLISSYLEALKLTPLDGAQTPADWQLLTRVYTTQNDVGVEMQKVLNGATAEQAQAQLDAWLAEIGYSTEQIGEISELAASDTVAQIIAANQEIVTGEMNTLKIPTIIYDGVRHDGLVSVEDLTQAEG
ncbi:MAG TPA: hypothetical protein GX406_03510 [Pseudoclavibacter sp.]|nr:hypothetical protein [Pseudoclavibacter sp.]